MYIYVLHIDIYIYICVYIYMYIYMCVCVSVCIHLETICPSHGDDEFPIIKRDAYVHDASEALEVGAQLVGAPSLRNVADLCVE